jgi:hypothetical protein
MSSGRKLRLSRRQMLKLTAGTVVLGAAGAELAQGALTASAAAPAAPTAKDLAVTGRVIAVGGGDTVQVQALETKQHMQAPLVGFPAGVAPRPGDYVTVTNVIPGYPLAALPQVSWVRGTPTARRDGTIAVGGRRVVASPNATWGSRPGAAVRVCILDTSLPAGQVMAVRA